MLTDVEFASLTELAGTYAGSSPIDIEALETLLTEGGGMNEATRNTHNQQASQKHISYIAPPTELKEQIDQHINALTQQRPALEVKAEFEALTPAMQLDVAMAMNPPDFLQLCLTIPNANGLDDTLSVRLKSTILDE